VAPPILSLGLSVLLIVGVDSIGLIALSVVNIKCLNSLKWLRLQASIVGAAILSVLLSPFALTGFLNRLNSRVFAIILIILGVINLIRIIRVSFENVGSIQQIRRLSTGRLLFFFILGGLFLLTLSPITDADSLDYHVGVALDILNTGAFTFNPAWFHSRLAGSGEVLIALGLSIGAEQFGALLQFTGLMGIAVLFTEKCLLVQVNKPLQPGTNLDWEELVSLAVISCPIWVAWVASPKPFLLPIGMTTLALVLTLITFSKKELNPSYDEITKIFTLICFLIIVPMTMKLNFILSGSLVGVYALICMRSRSHILFPFIIALTVFLMVLFPWLLWKYLHYGGYLLEGLINPFPGSWPGTGEFQKYLLSYKDTNILFPFSLIFPSSLGFITTVLGVGIIFPAFVYRSTTCYPGLSRILFVLSGMLFVLDYLFGQLTSRFFLEPFIWLMFAIQLKLVSKNYNYFWLNCLTLTQAFAVLLMISIGVVSLVPGSFNEVLRNRVMSLHASNYDTMQYVDSVLPKNARLLLQTREVALSPRTPIANDWSRFLPFDSSDGQVYRRFINNQKPNFILTSTSVGGTPNLFLGKCSLKIFAGPYISKIATRNPLNSNGFISSWILSIEDNSTNNCLE